MKKSELITGIIYVLVGAACLTLALCTDTSLEGLLWGLAGAGVVPGIGMIIQYFYWSSPKNRTRYAEIMDNKSIEMNDELNNKLRDQSGRQAYHAVMLVTCASILVFSILGSLGVLDDTRLIVIYLGAFLAFQIVIGIAMFNRLLKKY